MSAILTITLNPTVDLSTEAAGIAPERKLRCTRPRFDPGGGGLNVSRAIKALGGHSTAFVALNGPTGDKVMHLLSAHGIGLHPFPAPEETRQSITVTDSQTATRRPSLRTQIASRSSATLLLRAPATSALIPVPMMT